MNVQFKKGNTLEDLNNQDLNPGTFYFVANEKELYFDLSETERIKIVDTDLPIFQVENTITLEI